MNAKKDNRFANNPLVVDVPNIRFYAACPLTIEKNYHIGAFCIMDVVPRYLSNQEFNLLCDIARMAERELIVGHETFAKKASRIVDKVRFKLIKVKFESEEKRDERR
ncbi:GAF domain-containing protein [Candidatus Roizmanbacteria bacterium]|nr:GAF domain-containing protein [Candidatus Roizmanbacteria bacterium]